MARPKKYIEEEIEEKVEEKVVEAPKPSGEQFDPSLPESKQRHLR